MTTTQAGMAGFAPKVSISPIIAQSPDKTRIGPPQTIIEPSGVVWSIRSDGNVLRARSATIAPVAVNGRASEMAWTGGAVYSHSPTAPNHWWKLVNVKPNGTVTWADVGTTDPVPQVIPPPPPPPPPLPGTSPDGTTVPPAASIVTASGDVWKLGGAHSNSSTLKVILLNGVAVDAGVILEIKDGVIYTRGGVNWWRWTGTAFVDCGAGFDPNAAYAAPVFSFPNPLLLAVGRPTSLLPYVSSWLPPVFDVIDTPIVSVTADGTMTAKVAGNAPITSFLDDGH